MTYYLCIDDKEPIEIGNTTLGGTLLAEEGWKYIQVIIENYETISFEYKIKDDKGKTYSLDSFLDKMKRIKIIEEN
ncbi:MAG: hypothetical protein HQ541_04355 [Mariniphaga sp.]|nr:hypothetical protein [Mariniphaga sp.]